MSFQEIRPVSVTALDFTKASEDNPIFFYSQLVVLPVCEMLCAQSTHSLKPFNGEFCCNFKAKQGKKINIRLKKYNGIYDVA